MPLVESKAKTEPLVESKAEPVPLVESKAKTEAPVESKAKTEPLVESKAEPVPLVESKAKTEPLVESKAKTEAPVESKAEPEAPVESKAKTEAPVESKAEPEAPVESTTPVEFKAQPEVPMETMHSHPKPVQVMDTVAENDTKDLEEAIKNIQEELGKLVTNDQDDCEKPPNVPPLGTVFKFSGRPNAMQKTWDCLHTPVPDNILLEMMDTVSVLDPDRVQVFNDCCDYLSQRMGTSPTLLDLLVWTYTLNKTLLINVPEYEDGGTVIHIDYDCLSSKNPGPR